MLMKRVSIILLIATLFSISVNATSIMVEYDNTSMTIDLSKNPTTRWSDIIKLK